MKQECLNCGHVQEVTKEHTKKDDLGKYTVCEECKSSFDIQE